MQNIQIIDGALNCTYDIFAASDRDFRRIFPRGTDIAFDDELGRRLSRRGVREGAKVLERLWQRPVEKARVVGIHGTLFYGLAHKKPYYPTRRDSEMVLVIPGGRVRAQRSPKAGQ